ncbi:Similar to Trappc12: Trafficking protein particle complex subunit 12 (Mus musculus) [Cotesia congregata]|uniref:Similar to Trappc12: Trafficking protein particle complex subunit 12 (Mus musculus) n=1 Tax=Cotesia congregata TaxID=51543 RepID=A0A8J2H505_COTCN|nr:Similar to Trappc12: Trafficking protein particle complex subunit 12 (Mus musculus) [Cotesia congregata]
MSTICDSAYKKSNLEDNDLTKELNKVLWLNVMGMNHEPVNITRPKVEKRSAPAYLMNVYSNVVTKLTLNYTNFDLTSYDLEKGKETNMIVSYNANKILQHSMQRLWYNVITNDSEDSYVKALSSADLRLYRDISLVSEEFQGLPFNITVYRYKKAKLNYINSVIVEADHQGWIVIDITSCVQWWTAYPEDNEGLKLAVNSMKIYNLVQYIQPENIGISGFDGEPEKFAFVVGYYKTTLNRQDFLGSFRNERSASTELNVWERKVLKYRNKCCQLRGMRVNFNEIGYSDWIIAPDGVEANDCIGRCFGDVDVSIHASMESLVKLHGLSKLMVVRCKPIKYSPGNILLLLGELPIYWGDSKEAIDNLYKLLATIEQILKNLELGLSEEGGQAKFTESERKDSTRLWTGRKSRVLISIVNCALSVKNFSLAIDVLEDLCAENWTAEQLEILKSSCGRVYLFLGDVAAAEKIFAGIKELRDGNSPTMRELIDRGLMAVAQNSFQDAYNCFKIASASDPSNVMLINNMAVCLLYSGQLKAAVQLLEAAVMRNPIKSLQENVLLNVSTLYELHTTHCKQSKLQLLRQMNRYKGDAADISCLKLT